MESILAIVQGTTPFSEVFTLYGDWMVFISVFFTGETAILASFMLVEQGQLSFGMVFVLAFLATLMADMFWFMVGRFFPASYIPTGLKTDLFTALQKFLDRFIKDRIFLTILCMKFFIGTRLMIILYCARSSLSTTRFVYYNTISILFYLSVLAVVGILVGEVVKNIVPTYQLGTTIMTVILVGVVLVSLIRFLVKKYLLAM